MVRFANALIVLVGTLLSLVGSGRADDLFEAQDLIQRGEYELALQMLEELTSSSESIESSTVQGELLTLLGRHREAAEILRPLALREHTTCRALLAYANLLVSRGQLSQALRQLDLAVDLDRTYPQAHLLRGQVHTRLGHRARARRDFQDLVSSYQAGTVSSAGHMTAVGIAYHRMERYEEANSIFGLALEIDPRSVEARLAWATLLYEKYRPDQAEGLLQEVLAINPRHPRAKVLLARIVLQFEHDAETASSLVAEALEINENLPEAHELLAEIALDDEDDQTAIHQAEVVLEINPTRLESLSLLAAAYYLLDDLDRYRQVEQRVLDINESYATFYCVVANFASHAGWHEEAAQLYRRAMEIDPNDALASLGLGIALSRLGDDAAGLTYLRQARERDPFNIQAYHLVHFYEHTLNQYEVVESEHFRFRFHQDERPVLQPYVVPLAEWVYDQYVQRYQFEPQLPISIEIFADMPTFAVRSTGIPQVDAHGMSFGRVVTSRSPAEGNYNWGEVLAHELSHSFTLQLSRSRIPRWLSEGLAEYDTHLLRPEWHREGGHALVALLELWEIPSIQDLSRAFIRSEDTESVLAAYITSMQAVEFMVVRWGQEAPLRVLRRVAQGHRFPEALMDITGLDVAEFDAAFEGYLRDRYQPLMGFIEPNPLRYRDQAYYEAQARAQQSSAQAWAELAMAKFFALRVEESEAAFRRALELDPNNPLGHLLAGWFAARQRRYEEAHAHFEQILAGGFDGYNVRVELAAVARREGRTSQAIEHYRRAQEIYPQGSESYRDLADIYLRAGDEVAAIEQLQQLVLLDQFDIQAVLTLLQLLVAQQRYEEAWAACTQGNQIHPFHAMLHQTCAQVAVRLQRWQEAQVELEVALALDEGDTTPLRILLEEVLFHLARLEP